MLYDSVLTSFFAKLFSFLLLPFFFLVSSLLFFLSFFLFAREYLVGSKVDSSPFFRFHPFRNVKISFLVIWNCACFFFLFLWIKSLRAWLKMNIFSIFLFFFFLRRIRDLLIKYCFREVLKKTIFESGEISALYFYLLTIFFFFFFYVSSRIMVVGIFRSCRN